MEKVNTMENRFKAYLEGQFRQIAPTKSAMEYRKSLLIKMLDRTQDLRIKGMNDDELIYNTVIAELGDLASDLSDYENKTIKAEVTRKVLALSVGIGLMYIVVLLLAYLIVGLTYSWHPTWLIIVGGLLLGLSGLLIYFSVRLSKKKQFLPVRALVVAVEVLISTTVFLFLQIVGRIDGSWMTYLVMVALILLVDTVIAFVSNSKFKWLELPVAVEVMCVMLYVLLGLTLQGFWHPGWMLCLGGFVFAIIECIIVLAKRAQEKKKQEIADNTVVDEIYWTKWD